MRGTGYILINDRLGPRLGLPRLRLLLVRELLRRDENDGDRRAIPDCHSDVPRNRFIPGFPITFSSWFSKVAVNRIHP
jgi:hypothetical protein